MGKLNMQPAALVSRVARFAAIVGQSATIVLYLVLNFANPYAALYQGNPLDALPVSLLQIVLALFGIVAAWRSLPAIMLIVFLVQFWPVGFYMLGVPSLFRWIGVLNLLFLLAALFLSAEWIWSRGFASGVLFGRKGDRGSD